jgi:hypothetical protein
LSTLTGTQVLLLIASETGNVYTFATPKLQPLITKPEGKTLIQACLNPPDMTLDMPVPTPTTPVSVSNSNSPPLQQIQLQLHHQPSILSGGQLGVSLSLYSEKKVPW